MASHISAVKRILLINIAHPAIGSRIPKDHLPPLGLLCIGEPLSNRLGASSHGRC